MVRICCKDRKNYKFYTNKDIKSHALCFFKQILNIRKKIPTTILAI